LPQPGQATDDRSLAEGTNSSKPWPQDGQLNSKIGIEYRHWGKDRLARNSPQLYLPTALLTIAGPQR
jgi:hypothetical protein